MAIYGYPFSFLFNQMRDGADGSLAGGTVTFYAAGTTTPKAVWLDRAMTSPSVGGVLTPITLSADGTAAIFGLGLYKVVVKNASGVTVYTYDNINQIDPTYTDDITTQLTYIATLTSPAQAQIDGKVFISKVNGTSTSVVDNSTGTSVTMSSTNSGTGKSASVKAIATGILELNATDAVLAPNVRFTGVASSDVNTLDAYEEGSFTGTLTGCTTSPTATIRYTKIGRLVMLYIPGVTATSNSGTMTITGMPAVIVPTLSSTSLMLIEDNGVYAVGRVKFTNGLDYMDFYATLSGAGTFTASGTKGVGTCSLTYMV